MVSSQATDKQKLRKDRAKKAIALAMQNRWSDALATNLSILSEFADDLEAYNRLGKALTELGRTAEAKEAFQRALEISPNNVIAKKNLGRLTQLGDEAPRTRVKAGKARHAFIEESGKAGVTTLASPAPAKSLLKHAPGDPVQLQIAASALQVVDPNGEYVGQVEPRLASRLLQLMKGGNRYDATVTSVGEGRLTVIIREVYQHPSMVGTVSFPLRGGPSSRVYLPGTILGYEAGEDDGEESSQVAVKDWSDDDTEPGDDEAFSPVVHRIINTGDDAPASDREGI